MKTEQNINEIIRQQLRDILDLRTRMSEVLNTIQPSNIISVGEGTEWDSTWIGHCILHNRIPISLNSIYLLDIVSESNSFFVRKDLCKRYSIIPVFGDATHLPYANCYFDLVVAPLMIDDCSNHELLIYELERCTKNNGIFVVAGHGLDAKYLSRKVPGIIGAHHKYACDLPNLEKFLLDQNIPTIYDWKSFHCWLKVLGKKR